MLDQNTKTGLVPLKEIGTLPIRLEIEEPEGYVLTPRDEDLRNSVFGPVAIISCRLDRVLRGSCSGEMVVPIMGNPHGRVLSRRHEEPTVRR